MERFTDGQKKDLRVLAAFVRVYCRAKHAGRALETVEGKGIGTGEILLCRECAELLAYAWEKRRRCPLDPKPSCKKCHIHCYGKDYREKLRSVMAFSGRRMVLRGRIDYLWHYLF